MSGNDDRRNEESQLKRAIVVINIIIISTTCLEGKETHGVSDSAGQKKSKGEDW